ncbi:hypothetical protein CEXT_274441 [Caerostris extrusa]|uniref:Uncharacterized protein n=1 Tax=Caerostris extrusa TaxID=172846 RepID=A0AAV4P5U5_CAEEX|nr:hypothetical protein CEXT_274441 [Caerostris extrusa]
MNKKSAKKINRKKTIPIYFQKNQASISQILTTAHYKRRVKEMMKINKELALSLQEVRCRAADQEKALADFNRENTQMIFAKMKIKDMVNTVQKLVTDMSEVVNYMDGKQCNFLKNSRASHDEMRLKLLHPNISLIEENTSELIIEPSLNNEHHQHCEINPEPGSSKSIPESDAPTWEENSITEVYNLPSFTATETRSQDPSIDAQSIKARVSNKSAKRSSPCSLDLSGTPQTPVFPDFIKPLTEIPKRNIAMLELNTLSSSPTIKKTEPTVSKYPN